MPVIGGGTATNGLVSPSNQNLSWNRQQAVPVPGNVYISSSNAEFVEYSIQFENSGIDWLDIEGYEGQNNGYLLNFDGSDSLSLKLKNMDQLSGNNYKATLHFYFSKADGAILHKTSVINLNITGTAVDAIVTEKTNYTVVYRRNTNQLSGETHINVINNNAGSNLTFETIGTLFNELTFTTGFDLAEDPNFPFSTNPELPATGNVVVACRLKKDGQYIYSFTVTIVVINNEDVIVDPGSFNFELRKGFNEVQQATLKVINPLNKSFTVTAPSWIQLSIAGGASSVDLGFSTINSENITAGNYNGNISIAYDNKNIDVPVYLVVKTFAEIEEKDFHFCGDGIWVNANRMFDSGIFFRVKLKMHFETQEGVSEFNSTYSIPYFNDKAKTDLGAKVENYFPIFRKHLFDAVPALIYRPAIIQLIVEELDVNYKVLVSRTISEIKIFAGKKPLKFPFFTNYGLKRRYSKLQHIFSWYSGLVEESEIGFPNDGNNNDVVSFLTDDSVNLEKIDKKYGIDFLPFPDAERQVILQYLNNNLVPECLVFSGSYVIQDEFEHFVDSYQINGKKYATKEVGKITIKTGFILKEEILQLKEIAKSIVSFLKIGDNIYDCVCTTAKLVREDSEENLIQREMEFFIVL